MAVYTGRSVQNGAITHLLIGDEHQRVAMCGLKVPTARRSWRWTPLHMTDHKRDPFMPVTCKQCIRTLMGRAFSPWSWDDIYE